MKIIICDRCEKKLNTCPITIKIEHGYGSPADGTTEFIHFCMVCWELFLKERLNPFFGE